MIKTGYWRNILNVGAATGGAQAITLLGYVFLARIYGTTNFGIFATWLGITSIISVVLTGALETSLVLDEDGEPRNRAAIAVLQTAFLAMIMLAAVIGIVALAWAGIGEHLPVEAFLILAPAGFLLASATIFQSWASASGHFLKLNVMRVVQAILTAIFPAIAGLLYAEAMTLIICYVLGLGIVLAGWLAVFAPDRNSFSGYRELRLYWQKRKRYFLYALPAVGIGSAAVNMPVLIVNYRFDAASAGLLALALRVLGAPTSLIGIAIRDVFKRHASVAFRERGECLPEFRSTALVLGLISLLFAIFLYFFSVPLFEIVFGPEWRQSGVISIWLLPVFTMAIVTAPLTYMVYITSNEHIDFVWQTLLFLLIVPILLFVPTLRLSLLSFSAVYTSMYVIYLFVCYRLAKGSFQITPAKN